MTPGSEATPVGVRPPAPGAGGEDGFRSYTDGLIHSWLATLTALGFTLVPLFLILDYFTAPGPLLTRFAIYRFVATGFCLAVYLTIRRTRPTRGSFLYGYLFSIVVAGAIVWMTVDLGGFDSGYYAGLNLVIAAVNLLLPWRPIHSAINGLMVVVLYAVANALFGGPFHLELLIGNLYFMVSTVVIAVAISYARHDLIRKEFDLREELVETNAKLDTSRRELKSARDALWGEMEVAKRIQTALLPPDQRLGGYQVAAAMYPAAEVGGDYYDLLSPPGERHWIAVGDVSGHGVESGLVMMMTQTAILSLVRQDPGLTPAGVFQAVNGVLFENNSRLGSNRYMTLNVVRLEERGFTVAGKHQDILIWRRAERRVETISNDGCWIGVVADVRDCAPDTFVPMAEGDHALFFTDGVTEAQDDRGEMYGQDRLAAALARAVEEAPPEALRALLQDVAHFAPTQEDDRTLVLVRCTSRAS